MRILLKRYRCGISIELPQRRLLFCFSKTHLGVDGCTQVPSVTHDKTASVREGLSAVAVVVSFNNALFMLLKKLQCNHLSEGSKGSPITHNAHNTHNSLSLPLSLTQSLTFFLYCTLSFFHFLSFCLTFIPS